MELGDAVNNAFDELTNALAQAEEVKRAAKSNADKMMRLLLDGDAIRSVAPYLLIRLKKELQGFNIQKRAWRRP